MKKWILIGTMSFLTFTSIAQDCTKTYEYYNQILIEHDLYQRQKSEIDLNALDIKNCLGCDEVNNLYTIYNGQISNARLNDFLSVIAKNKCYRVQDSAFQKIILENKHLLKKGISYILCDYLIDYEQLIRGSGDTDLFRESDSISYELLQELILDSTTNDIVCLFPILLHGSDLLPVEKIDEYEKYIHKLVQKGTLYPFTGAHMLDRVYYTRFGKQKFGTLYIRGKEFSPFENIEKIDSIRRDLYCYPLEITIRKYDVKRPEGYTFNN